ncbi:hypothetical protein BFG51_16180 [Dietzia alimentaria]|nr:hypothetical protein BFG51_16180 [Dietzia alimentaria]
MIWLLGAHGGAGVSTLESMWAPAADSQRGWPSAEKAPFVVVVARMHTSASMQRTGCAFSTRQERSAVARCWVWSPSPQPPAKPDLTLSRRRELVAAAAGASWHIDWVPELLTSEPTELAQWTPDYTPPPAKRFARPLAPTDAVPESVATAAAEVFAAAGEQWRNRPGKP